jgi:hypothetical protein
MTISIKVGGAWKSATPYVKVAGVWKAATAYIKVAGVWKAIASLTASASPDPINTAGSTSTLTSGGCTCAASNSVGALSYSWSFVTTDGGITILSPNSATTQFRATAMGASEARGATAICAVTDAGTGQSVFSNAVEITFERI